MAQPWAELIDKAIREGLEKHRPFASMHEAYAVMLEEMDELWDEIKKQRPDPIAIQAEAVQVAACAIRLIQQVEEWTWFGGDPS